MIDFSIEFHAESLIDSRDAYVWYELQQEGLGERLLQKVWEKIEIIARSPETFGKITKRV